ncbi:alpha/beta fold hydrolase [Pseudorhodoferax sp.]|uniref:alpha/beta fold hydrolase n=1 Tax=Pseudorhodoferax sp. TaxID=1993553 RepID=UPI002DD6A68D|nr:alpha/beta fold hydrolase [Pseudorhodoferax sp.]
MPISTTPLVLVPGLLCDALLWAPQIEGLAGIADAWVPAPTQHATVDELARAALADCPFEQFALAGLSMGGYIAMAMQRLAPQRVTRLALLDTNAVADAPAASAARRELVARSQAEGLGVVADTLLPRLVWPQAPRHAALQAVVRSMAHNVGVAAFARQQQAIIGRPDARAALRAVACPLLVACGAQDILTPPALHEEMASLVPGAQLVLFPDCGHLSPLEQPALVTQARHDWLQPR